jgi:hypothetical protein
MKKYKYFLCKIIVSILGAFLIASFMIIQSSIFHYLFLYIIPDNIITIGSSCIIATLIFLTGFIFGPLWGLLVGCFGTLIGASYDIWKIMELKTIEQYFGHLIVLGIFQRMIHNGLYGFLMGIVPVICKYKSINKRILSYNVGILFILFCDYLILTIILKYDSNLIIFFKGFVHDQVIPIFILAILGSIFLYFYYKFLIPKVKNKIS